MAIHRDLTNKPNGVANGVTPAVVVSAGPKSKSQIDKNLIGICVVAHKTGPQIRFSLRPHHLKDLGGKRIDIRGTLRDGLLLVPGKSYKPFQVSVHLCYLQISLRAFDGRVPETPRALVWLRPTFEDGHIKLPGLPEAWIRADPEFRREVHHDAPMVFEQGKREVQLSPFPRDGGTTIKAETNRVEPPKPAEPAAAPTAASTQGATAPLPKAVPAYQVPAGMRELQAELAGQISAVRATLKAMEDRTGLQFTLDRNLRVALILKEPEK